MHDCRPASRYKPRRLYDFGRVLHELQLNAWVLALRRHAGPAFVAWDGECSRAPERQRRSELDDPIRASTATGRRRGCATRASALSAPDAVIELARSDDERYRSFLVEFDRTHRVDKNFDKFRRYDSFLCWWWQRLPEALDGQPPFVVFVCQDESQRELFMRAADHELTGHRWHPGAGPERCDYVGRRRILFALERDAHAASFEVWRLPQFPSDHPCREPRAADPARAARRRRLSAGREAVDLVDRAC